MPHGWLLVVGLGLCIMAEARCTEVWYYAHSVCTGLGDRVCALLSMAAVARAFNVTVVVPWCTDPMASDALGPLHLRFIPGWTGWRYPPPAHLPPGVRLLDVEPEASKKNVVVDWASRVPPIQALGCLPRLGHELFQLPPHHTPVSQAAFEAAYHSAAAEGFLPRAPRMDDNVVVLHIRTPNRNTHVRDERPSSFCTCTVVRMLLAAGLRVVALTDGRRHARRVLGRAYRHLLLASSKDAWADMDRIAHARGIVQHASEGWSSYSGVPALARRVPLLNTFLEGEATTSEHRHDLFESYGGLPPHFYRCREARLFVAAVLDRGAFPVQ